MDFSFRYTAEDHCAALPVADYIARFRDAKRFLECCRACRNYGCSWGCPPFGYDVGAYLSQYTSALIIATKITPAEQHVPMSEAGRLIRPERQRLERRLLEMERRYGGRSFAYVGTCLYCPEGTCTRPEAKPLPPPRTGTPIARSLRIRHRTHDLRTLRHRTEMGYRRIIARVFDPCLRVLP